MIKNDTMHIKIFITVAIFAMSMTTMAQVKIAEPSERVKLTPADSALLMRTWESFRQGILKRDHAQLKGLALSSVYFAGLRSRHVMAIDPFIDSVMTGRYSSRIAHVIQDSVARAWAFAYRGRKVSNFRPPKGQPLTLYEVYFRELIPKKGSKFRDVNFYVFRFVKTGGAFKFFELYVEDLASLLND
jgi:hypothetical protein